MTSRGRALVAVPGACVALVALVALISAVAGASGWGLPPDASTEGWRVDRLFASTHALVAVAAAIAFGGLALALWRFRGAREPTYSHGTSRRAIAVPLAAAAFLLLVVDGNLFFTSLADLRVLGDARGRAAQDDAVKIQLTARQWSWEARYPGPDGAFGTDQDVVVTDHLRVPEGRPVVVQLASVDVVHALHLPNFRVVLQAIPGRISSTWFEAAETGRFEIACAQHCGVFHYKMRGTLDVVTDDAFAAWIEHEAEDAARVRAERARAADEETAPRPPWPRWQPAPEAGPWSWEAGLEGEGAPPIRDREEGGS